MIDSLKDESEKLGVVLNPTRIMIDFEKGAFQVHFLKGAFLITRMQSTGFKTTYAEDAEFRVWVKVLICLPLYQN